MYGLVKYTQDGIHAVEMDKTARSLLKRFGAATLFTCARPLIANFNLL